MTACPYCGQPLPPDTQICPHCGADRRAVVWPPPIFEEPSDTGPALLTGSAWGDFIMGMVVCGVTFLCWGAGIVLVPFIYFFKRRKYALFTRVLGWTYIGLIAAFGGMFYVCDRIR